MTVYDCSNEVRNTLRLHLLRKNCMFFIRGALLRNNKFHHASEREQFNLFLNKQIISMQLFPEVIVSFPVDFFFFLECSYHSLLSPDNRISREVATSFEELLLQIRCSDAADQVLMQSLGLPALAFAGLCSAWSIFQFLLYGTFPDFILSQLSEKKKSLPQ